VIVGGQRLEAVTKLDAATERLHLGLPRALAPGAVTLHIDFRGTLNDLLRGFYRSTFIGDDGVTHVIATTQMEATDCRRAFPCWDEPDFKAVFALTLVIDSDLSAVSNSPEIGREPQANGKVAVRFADTMKMSTYLVAMVVGHLEMTAPVDAAGTPLRIVHVPGKGHLTALAIDAAAASLAWFQDYYGIPYPADKVDLLALPDFAAGAMENLGCITFRENLLLIDPATSTQQEQQVLVDVVAHELAHMWFGDLVTMRWWNGIWLNEAFATFMEVAACDSFRPGWDRWTTFSLERSGAFDTDGLRSTRPVEFEVISPEDADGMFDVLTYEKGASLLRMLEQHLGPERFRDGIRHYLRTHAYDNTDTSDLWDAIESVTQQPVRRIMDSWIWQGGHPSLSVEVRGDEVRLRQRRFLYDGGEDDATMWVMPVQLRQAVGGAQRLEKLLIDTDEVGVPLLGHDAVVVANAGGHGFYRVEYSPELLERLSGEALQTLSTAERYVLVDDTWASVIAGRRTALDFCRFAEGFAAEEELAVWQALLAALRLCDRVVDGDDRSAFQRYVGGLVGPALARLGWEPSSDDGDLRRELRGQLIRAMALLAADQATIDRARATFREGVAGPAVLAACTSITAATGDEADYEHFLAGFLTADTPQERLRFLYGLAEFPSQELMDRTLAFAVSGEVRTQNAPFLLNRCIAQRELGAHAWRFVREHWPELVKLFPDNLIVRMIDPVKLLLRPEQQADVSAFFAEHPIPQSAKTLSQVLERQQVNMALFERDSSALGSGLAARR
jgi:puromycin-sensitive aminopeptidase